MSEGVVTFLLVKLGDFLLDKGKLLAPVKDEAEYISDELEFMTAFLRLADAMEDSDPVLKLLVKKVRDVAYDTEDALDDFRLCLCHDDGHGLFSIFRRLTRSIKDARARRRIASKIQCIKSRVISISESHRRYCNKNNIKVHGSISSNNIIMPASQVDALLVEDGDLVGIERRKRQLIERLLGMEYGREVVSVVGMGGLGKSTLVKKVYDDPDVKKHFKFRAWVFVSQSFKTEDLLKGMIKQLFHVSRKLDAAKKQDRYGLDRMDCDKLSKLLNKFLQQRRYLIVLDDLWHINVWDALRHVFPNNTYGSRILLTTRNNGVAAACCMESPNNVYVLNPLSPEESWTLFCKKIFQKSSCPRHLKRVSESILARCEGLPLAIVAVSGVLATKDKSRIDEWEMVHRSIGAELECNLKSILSLSYNDLPYYLKSCFLYLSIFPEGSPIDRARLARLWIAEGFVKEKEGATLEEVAEDYLSELLKRSLVQVVETTSDGRVKTCRIHDLLRESIISKSRDQDFAAVVKDQGMAWPDKVRRVSVHNACHQMQLIDDSSRLRSLLMFWGLDMLQFRFCKFHFCAGGLRLLNVLDLQGAPLTEFPTEVISLLLLKYLSLRNTKVNSVPNSIGTLQHLETLDLKHSHVTELPVEILKLQKLRHLLVYRYHSEHDDQVYTKYGFKAPAKIGVLQSIQKLCFIEAEQGSGLMIQLGRLNQLRRLGIVKLRKEDGKALCSSIEKLRDLHALSITSTEEDEIIDLQYLSSPPPFLQRLYLTGRQEKLPKWIFSLHFLVKLVLKWTSLYDDPLLSLQNLPNLVHLEFVQAYDGEILRFRSGGFQRLRVLGLNRLNRLKSITVQNGAMPCLQSLAVQSCKLLEKVPYGIKHLTELKVLEFLDMPIDFIKRLRPDGEGEDYQKVQKIPEVYCTFQIKNGSWDVYSVENFREVKCYPIPNTPKRSAYNWKP
ncbi:hypothetical protein Tsubulata_006641 [Turnera subulata]|uniref:NB-ARC domain-containing protein n=1 Tax=Turnera subulata TaxID=218843 RepID=A0A9Q0FDD4_9ROSI|nr:hypothetical protein Tsubulata_006641 [Turnera subulata]